MEDADKTDRFLDPSLLTEAEDEDETQDLPVSDVTEPSIKIATPRLSPAARSHLNEELLKKARSIREQRDVIRQRLEKIEASKGQVKESVYRKVAGDYVQRLEETRKNMLAVKAEIDEELALLYDKEKESAGRVHEHEEALEEAGFRRELGEFAEKDYQELARREEAALQTARDEQSALQAAIGQYETVFAGEDLEAPAARSAPVPSPPPAAPKPAAAPKPSPAVGVSEPRVATRTGVPPAPRVAEAAATREPMAPTATGTILLRENGEVTGEFTIETELNIGRSPSNEIVLKEAKVSRRHAGIVRKSEGYVLTDNNSSNGTFVNGKKITEHLLRSGDMIQIGSYEMEFRL